jgi:hypothetical protein
VPKISEGEEHVQQALIPVKTFRRQASRAIRFRKDQIRERPSQENNKFSRKRMSWPICDWMEQEPRDIAQKASNDQKALSQKLQAAANFLRENRLEESLAKAAVSFQGDF